jgi:hypothetical protein
MCVAARFLKVQQTSASLRASKSHTRELEQQAQAQARARKGTSENKGLQQSNRGRVGTMDQIKHKDGTMERACERSHAAGAGT